MLRLHTLIGIDLIRRSIEIEYTQCVWSIYFVCMSIRDGVNTSRGFVSPVDRIQQNIADMQIIMVDSHSIHGVDIVYDYKYVL